MAPSTEHEKSLPNVDVVRGVDESANSLLFIPSRAPSLWYVRTPARSVTAICAVPDELPLLAVIV
jgi:hypothetical protein